MLTLIAALQAVNLKEEKLNAEHQKRLAITNARIAEKNAEIAKSHAEDAEKNAEIARKNADKARDNAAEAEKQRGIATQNAKEARQAERKAKEALKEAEIAKRNAEIASAVANSERAVAIAARDAEAKAKRSLESTNKELATQRKEALSQRDAADKLRSLAEVRSNSTLAIRKLLEGKYEEAVLLARGAYRENIENKGPKHNIDNYLALSACVETFEEEKERNGEISLPDYRKIHTAPIRCITTATLPTQQEVIAYATEDSKLQIYPFDKKEQLLGQRLRSIAFSKEGKYLVGGTFKGELNLWQYQKKKEKDKNKPKHNYEYIDKSKKIDIVSDIKLARSSQIHYINFIYPTADKELLVFADRETVYLATIKEADNNEKIVINIFSKLGLGKKNNSGKITSVTASEDGRYIVVARTEEVTVCKLIYEDNVIRQEWSKIELKEEDVKITAMDITSVDGTYAFAFGYSSGAVRLVYGKDLSCVGSSKQVGSCDLTYLEHKSPVIKLLFNKDATQLVSAALDKSGKIWNLENEEEEKLPLIGHDKWIWDMIYSTDQKTLLTASQDRTIRKWSTTSSLLYVQLEELCKECIKTETKMLKENRLPEGFEPIRK